MTKSLKLVYLSTFLLAGSVLQLEIVLTRIFSVLTWHHFTYMIISIALLGFGAAGSYLTFKSHRESSYLTPQVLSRFAYTYAFSTIFSLLLITRISFEPLQISKDWTQLLSLIFYYILLSIPFFFAGLCLGGIITFYRDDINRIYFFDLAGASFGSLFSVVTIQYLGATNALFLGGFFAGLSGLMLESLDSRKNLTRNFVLLFLLLLCLISGLYFDPYLVYAPSSKDITPFVNHTIGNENVDLVKWHITARIDVTKPIHTHVPAFGGNLNPRFSPNWEVRFIFQDGAALTGILRSDGNIKNMNFLDKYLQAVPYQIKKKPKVLVIGVGGGSDVLIALYHDASYIVGVDVNPITVKLLKEIYRDYSGRLFTGPKVKILTSEGRHFVSRIKHKYDVIQLSGVDTFTALSTGAYALTENYLYTVEAIKDFWNRLSPNGVLSFSRWFFIPPRETLRLAVTMVEAMEEMGIKNPDRHILIVYGQTWAETLMKRSPFSLEEVQKIQLWAGENDFKVFYNPLYPTGTEYDSFLRADKREREKLYKSYIYNVRPTRDDNPYFFDYYKWRNLFKKEKNEYGYTITRFPLALLTLSLSLIQILVLAIFGIFYPLRRLRHSLLSRDTSLATVVYFGALGLGFILVEITIIQKFMVFLGGPTYSLSVTLFSILLFSGLGSFFSRFLNIGSSKALMILGILLFSLILAFSLIYPLAITHWLKFGLTTRIVLSILLIAPVAFVMGIPFPSGIRILSSYCSNWVPWAWATNSFMTVFGSLFCIFLSMHLGFQAVFVIASFIYLLGFLCFRRLLAK